jgi:hypothetical protein
MPTPLTLSPITSKFTVTTTTPIEATFGLLTFLAIAQDLIFFIVFALRRSILLVVRSVKRFADVLILFEKFPAKRFP